MGNGDSQKKKFLFVSIDGSIQDLAWHVAQEGHEVKYFIEEASQKDVGDGFVPKVEDWQKEAAWADAIIFDDVRGQGTKAKKLREEGKAVIGGTPYTDKLEDDRAFGQDELQKAGISVIPHWDFTSFDDAIKFVQENPDKYVIKPSGKAQIIKHLLFVGEEEDGKDVLRILNDYKTVWGKKIKEFQLQKRITGVEIAVGAFFNGKEFVTPINVNFEHKKLFPGNIGPATGEMGCYDEQTEVLTETGWKYFRDLQFSDKICTLNPENYAVEFDAPSDIVSFDHHKELLSIQNQTLDIMVTLDHNMYVCAQQSARKGEFKFDFVKARDLEAQSVVKRTGNWLAGEEKYFILPSAQISHYEGRQVVMTATPEIKIPMDDWVAFMGIWLADGYAGNGKVGIAQKNPEKSEKIRQLLEKLDFNFSRNTNEFYFYSKQFADYLSAFGKAPSKHVPEFIKKLGKRQIETFLEWFCLGDGTVMKAGHRIFYTCSKKLADDLQELLLKIGRVGVIKERTRPGKRFIVDHFANSNFPSYEVNERVKKPDSWIDKRDMKIIDYSGKVYCATVKNHVMYVRRNGKPFWCGNTSMFWSEPNKLFNLTLKKMESKLKEENYHGYIDINCIVNGNGVHPLEFTARFGYPTISIQQEGILTPIGEFLHGIASGSMSKFRSRIGFQIGVAIVLPPVPFSDSKTFEVYSKDAVIIFKKPNFDGIHIEDVKLVDNEWVVTGTSGWALVVTGNGQTMIQAQKQAYTRIKNILIPNMYYRKDIGDRWFEDSDKLHNWGYLRE
ncbi:MAG: LAGLIDADG family homing endonuclease [Candidatus ainarchaeum sp.]|nr:LAGLIDADG family homing endonuclease [Candidatus ainarchaeum sp.]